MDFSYYGTLTEADEYFDHRLFAGPWKDSDSTRREVALYSARLLIDTLNFKGKKASVHSLLSQQPHATPEQIREANASQEMEFPRGDDTEVPTAIRIACYELAFSLLDGRDPEMELENLGITSRAISSVRTTYHRDQVPIEHLINGIPNALAWRYLRPFLLDADQIKIQRVS